MAVAFPMVPIFPALPLMQTIFFLCCSLNDCKRAACSLFGIGQLFSLFCLSVACILILLLLLISGNVHTNPGLVFPCSVCVGNVIWRGRLVQCCICFKWIHLKYSLLSFSRFKTLGSSHSWSCSCCVPASSGDPTPTNNVFSSLDSSSLYTSAVEPGNLNLLCKCSTSTPPSPSKLSAHLVFPQSVPSPPFMLLDVFLHLLLLSPDPLWVL